MNRNLIIGGIVGILALSGAWYVFAATLEPVKEPVVLCPVVAEIFDKKLGSTTALTKGETGCVKIEDYIVASYNAGNVPVIDISKITSEERYAAYTKIINDLKIDPVKDKKNLYLAVREKLVLKGEIVAATKESGLEAETMEEYSIIKL